MVETNKDNYDTSYRTLKGFHIIGYDGDTDTFSKLHVDEDGHIYTKMLGAYGAGFVELASSVDGYLQNDITDRVGRELGKVTVNEDNKALVVYESGDVTYVCKAIMGTAVNAASWQIMKIDSSSGVVIKWADGNANYDNLASDLATVAGLSYS